MGFPEIVGLMPAGGQGTRIAPLPCSKELYPIGFRSVGGRETRPKVAAHYLLEKMRLAGVTRSYIILRRGKWDIPNYFGNGRMLDMHLAYLIVGLPFGTPYSLDEAYPFVQDTLVAFGFPDILFEPDDAFVTLLERQAQTEATVTLGLFPAEDPRDVDMVERTNDGRVRGIVAKPGETHLSYSWCIAVWTPVFTRFLHQYLTAQKAPLGSSETSVGAVIQAAIDAGLAVEGVALSHKPYVDIGTAENLVQALRRFGVTEACR